MNWKCVPASVSQAVSLAVSSDSEGVVVCPPTVFMPIVGKVLKKASLGAQNGFWREGAYTGESSFGQIKSVGVKYVIIGHSERRYIFGENPAIISKKISAALEKRLIPVLCVGERERKSVVSAVKEVRSDLISSLSGVPKERVNKIIIAYEPVWSIGNENDASLSEVEPVFAEIKNYIHKKFGMKPNVLYGGSVSPDNILNYVKAPFIDGALVGKASGDAKKAKTIIELVKNK